MTIRGRSWRYLIASVATAAISLVTLPLTTLRLGPTDYGVLALGTALAGLGGAIAAVGLGFAISNRWQVADRDERIGLVSTLTFTAGGLALAWAVSATLVFELLHDSVRFLEPVPSAGILLLMLGLIVSAPWLLATEILTLDGRATFFSAATVAQAVATGAATLVSLFLFEAGRISLFIGLFAGALVGLGFGLAVIRPYFRLRFDNVRRGDLAQGAFLVAQVTETVQSFLERVLLARFAGYADLGLYTHSQRYRAIAQQGAKAVGRGVWPVTLDEAREPDGRFSATRATWNAVQVAIVAVGLALTSLGDIVIGLLTNGKFTDAHVYLAPWFVYLLLQFSARPETGVLYALAPGRTPARLSSISNLAGIASALALIPLFGPGGAVAALLLQLVVLRVLVRVPARRLRRVPFQDGWVLVGIGWLTATWAVKILIDPGPVGDLALLTAAVGSWLAVAWSVVSETRLVLLSSPPLAPPAAPRSS